jgi:hypothetical protein
MNKWSKSRNKNQTDAVVFSMEPTIALKNRPMHIILQNLKNQYYKYKLKEKVLLITIYELVKQNMLQKLKYKNTKIQKEKMDII